MFFMKDVNFFVNFFINLVIYASILNYHKLRINLIGEMGILWIIATLRKTKSSNGVNC